MTNAQKNCLFIIAEEGKWTVKDHLKPLGSVYNGAGWYVEDKHRDIVSQICQAAHLRCIDFPLNESFEELKKRHRLSYFQEKAIKARLHMDGIKATLGISQIDTQELLSKEYRKYLEVTTEGQKFLQFADEYARFQEQIDHIEQEERLQALSKNSDYTVQPYPLEEIYNDLSKIKEGLKSGYAPLDEMIRIPNESITLIGGRPSHGKTTFMLNLFLNMVMEYPEQKFYFFSYEETRLQIAMKLINILGGWIFEESKNLIQLEGYLRCRSTAYPVAERGKSKYQELMENGRINIISEPYHAQILSAHIRNIRMKEPVGAIFIDYIQKIKNADRFGTRQLELQNTSSIILETAQKCSVPIILGAQLGRDRESRDKVRLENLREAGDLEQDASLVLGIYNPSMEKAQDEQKQLTDRVIDLKVTPLKNRNGIVNKTVTLEFDRPLLKIKDKKI